MTEDLLRLERALAERDASPVSGGLEALLAYRTHSPDLVITDIAMPDLSGLELIEAIRVKAGDRKTKIIVVTTRGKKEDAEKGLELGADAYLTKPVTSGLLALVVRRYLRQLALVAEQLRASEETCCQVTLPRCGDSRSSMPKPAIAAAHRKSFEVDCRSRRTDSTESTG